MNLPRRAPEKHGRLTLKEDRSTEKDRNKQISPKDRKIKTIKGGINLANYRSIVRKRQTGSSNAASVGANPEATRVRTPRKDRNEVLATVAALLGSKRVTLQCMDGVVRMGRIPGSKNKRIWIREGDVVIANPWEIQDTKADVIWKYTRPQVDWLEKKGYLN